MSKNSNQKSSVFLVTGSDTGAGKTVFTGLLGRYLKSKRIRVHLFKPFCSGEYKDIDYLKKAIGDFHGAEINYWYGEEPVSPAAWELSKSNQIDFENIVERMRQEFKRDEFGVFLVEGVGGLLAPITLKHTVASLGQELGANLIIVAQNRVGVINHVLLTVEAARSRALSVASVVLMGQEIPDASAADNATLIRMRMLNIPDFKGVFEFPWLGEEAHNPESISINVKKAQCVLEQIFEASINPCLFSVSNH